MKDYLSDPLDWSLPEIEQLRDLFVLVYEDRGIAREFAYKAGLLRGTFTEATNRIGQSLDVAS